MEAVYEYYYTKVKYKTHMVSILLLPTTYLGTKGGNVFRCVCPSVHWAEGGYILSRQVLSVGRWRGVGMGHLVRVPPPPMNQTRRSWGGRSSGRGTQPTSPPPIQVWSGMVIMGDHGRYCLIMLMGGGLVSTYFYNMFFPDMFAKLWSFKRFIQSDICHFIK